MLTLIVFLRVVISQFMLPLWGFHTTLGYVYGTAVGGTMVAATQAVCAGAAFMCSRHVARPYISP